ncbi:MAG: hypothetical protein AAF710_12200 [Planctomycetota bacterium]
MRLSAAAVVMVFASSVHALTPAELTTPQLERQPISLTGLDGGVLRYFDDDRRLAERPTSDFVRLTLRPEELVGPEDSTTQAAAEIELIDGQRLTGRWAAAARGGEAVVWEHASLGTFTLGLDDLRGVAFAGAGGTEHRGATLAADTAILRNGDRIAGFVVAVSETSVTLLPDGADAEVQLPLAGLASLTFANPAGDAGVAGDLVRLTDGSRVRAGGVGVRRGTFRLTPSLADQPTTRTLPLASVAAVDFAAAGLRLIELTDRPLRIDTPSRAFGLDWPAEIAGDTLRLHAPAAVRFVLPPGARRFAGTAELDLPLGLSDAQRRLANTRLDLPGRSFRLHAGRSRQDFNLPLSPRDLDADDDGAPTLPLRLDPAAHGPLLDRVRLRDLVVLVDSPDPRPGTDPDAE